MKTLRTALAGLFSLFAVAAAFAQSAPATMGYHTVYGRLGAVPGDTGPGQAIPFSNLVTQLLASPINGTVTITPPAHTVTQGINITQSGPTTGPGSSNIDYNLIAIADPAAVSAANQFTNGLRVIMSTGSNNAFGSKATVQFVLNHATSVAAPGTTGDLIAMYALGQASAPNGGINTGAGAAGTIFAGSFVAQLGAGATNYFTVSGAEVDVGIEPGGTARNRLGWSIVGTGSVYPSTQDTALEIAAAGLAWKCGICFSDLHGTNPVSLTGTLISSFNAAGTPFTVENGIDFSNITFNTNFLKSNGFAVTGLGDMAAKSLSMTTVAGSGLTINDGTVTAIFYPTTLFTHSFEIGTISAHNLAFITNNVLSGFFDQSDHSFNVGAGGFSNGIVRLGGLTSGVVSIGVQGVAGTYNFNLPTTAGSSGQALLSGGGLLAPMTWATVLTNTPAALTKTDDTNVTLTLGGTPATALLQATSLTLGWTGSLSVARGGTGGGSASGTLLDNITGFASTGMLARTASGTYAFRTETGTANEITVTNGTGVSGNPTYSLPAALTFTGKTVTGGTFASPALSGTVTGANTIPLSILAQSGANTMLGNWTGSTANVSANAMPSCSDTTGNHLNYVSGTGITCGTSIPAATSPATTTPTPTCGGGSGTLSSNIQYVQQFASKWVNIAGTITITTLGTCASSISITLPVTASGTYGGGLAGINTVNGKPVIGAINPAGPTQATFLASDGTGNPATSNAQTIQFSGGYYAP